MGTFVRDLHASFRALCKRPGMVAVVVVSLGFGIGAATTVFSVANAFLFRTGTGFARPEGVVSIGATSDDGSLHRQLSFPDFTDLAASADAVEDAAAFGFDACNLEARGWTGQVLAQVVTDGYFRLLDAQPVLGRTFLPEETRPGNAAPVVILGEDLWQRRFAGAADVIGRSIRLNGMPFTIVGVARRELSSPILGARPDLLMPVGVPGASPRRSVEELGRRNDRNFMVLARLRPGRTHTELRAQLATLAARLRAQDPEAWTLEGDRARELSALPEAEARLLPGLRQVVAGASGLFLAIAALVLLIACSNLAGLFLARAHERRREMAVRAALGAGRWRQVRLLLTECGLLAAVGGLCGLAVAHVTSQALRAMSLPVGMPLHFDFRLDARVVLFCLATTVAATLAFGLGPALRGSRVDVTTALKQGCDGVAGRRRLGRGGTRRVLVVLQVAASALLLTLAMLMIRSLQGATRLDLGFDTSRIAVMSKELAQHRFDRPALVAEAMRLRDRLAGLPGVESAAVARATELSLMTLAARDREVQPLGETTAETRLDVSSNAVSPGYLEMLRIPLLRGRTLAATDSTGAPLVAVVNETFARRVFPDREPLGQRFEVREPVLDRPGVTLSRTFEVIGVTRDGKYADIDETPSPYFWTSLVQDPEGKAPVVAVLVKGSRSAAEMVELLRREVPPDPAEMVLQPPTTLASAVDVQLIHLRVLGRALGVAGLFGLGLAAVGIYGVLSFLLAQRTREVAIRVALGAEHGRVLRDTLGDGLRAVGLGLAIGLPLAVAIGHAARSQLFGVGPADPMALGAVTLVVALAAAAACAVPARRALRIDPMQILRAE
ncbi:MAG: ADOP family duplicated permease [Thermoanaerobaculaceae bacterium]|jgi:predicted permease|nr:ADOP family duplicated permease [Thermoanaerobaculaceae bacterium]